MRRIGTLIILLALTTAVLSGCAKNASAPSTSTAPKGDAASAAKPSPSPGDPAIKPPTKSGSP
jgi:hypothetical protein